MNEENEKWVGVYFRMPESMKKEFMDAVVTVYGTEKGAVGQCLRDLVHDFIEMTNRTESSATKTRVLMRILSKQTEFDNIPTNTLYSTIEPPTWHVFEELLQAVWAKTHNYPQYITINDFETLIANLRGTSRTTIWKWRKRLTKAGLIAIEGNRVYINYPIISGIDTIEDMRKKHLFKHFMFALLSPHRDIMRLIYTQDIEMNPRHTAIIMLKAEKSDVKLEMKALIPTAEWEAWLKSIDENKLMNTNVGILKVMQALIVRDGYKIIPAFYMDVITSMLTQMRVEATQVLAFPEI